MIELAHFQDAFARALLAAEPATELPVASQPGFAVYRNTVTKGCIDALQANYPAIARLVGDEWFRAAALVFVRAHPPRRTTLVDYGEGFADFLAAFEPAAALPYLPGVAQLERCWNEAHLARDAAPLDPRAIAGLPPEALACAVLRPHPAARWRWFDAQPIYTIWRRNRFDADPRGEIDWCAEGALLTRPRAAVETFALDAAGHAFLNACAAGEPLACAAPAALAADRNADLARLMQRLLQAGAFALLEISDPSGEPVR